MASSYSQFLFICPSGSPCILIVKPKQFGEGMGLSRRSSSLCSMRRMQKMCSGTVFAVKPHFPHTNVTLCAAVSIFNKSLGKDLSKVSMSVLLWPRASHPHWLLVQCPTGTSKQFAYPAAASFLSKPSLSICQIKAVFYDQMYLMHMLLFFVLFFFLFFKSQSALLPADEACFR